MAKLAHELGVSHNTLNRIRFGRSRYLDPEVFTALLELFGCEPNELLLPQPGIDYAKPD
jgi:transcriptional regulator with XRE-family HTH domain